MKRVRQGVFREEIRSKLAPEKRRKEAVRRNSGQVAAPKSSAIISQRKILGGKKRGRRPTSIVVSSERYGTGTVPPPLHDVRSFIHPTPPWFNSKGDAVVSVIVPLYKSAAKIEEQISSWDLNDYGIPTEVIYVSDACPQSSHLKVVQAWTKRKGELKGPVGKIVVNRLNGGYGRACNVGAEHASGKYLIFLNADTVMTPEWIPPIVKRFEADEEIGIVGNMHLKVINGVLTIDSAGSEWIWARGTFEHIGRHSFNGSPIPKPIPLDKAPKMITTAGEREMVTGACFGIKSDVFKEINGFELGFRIGYWEDSDICLRTRDKGYKIYYEPDSRIYHSVGHSGAGGHPYMAYNRWLFYNRWVDNGRIDDYVTPRKRKPLVRSIYLRRTSAHGDAMVAASVAAALKKRHPEAKITFETACYASVHQNPYIDRILPVTYSQQPLSINELKKSYQLVYDLNYAYENYPKRHMLESYAVAAGVKAEDCKLHVFTENHRFKLPKKYVVMFPGKTAWVGRNWQEVKFNEIAKRIKSMGFPVVSVGSRDHQIRSADVDLRGRTSVYQLARIIKDSQAYIGIDSFPMWMAQAFEKPGVVFFGSINPEHRLLLDNMKSVQLDLPCIGCHHEKPLPCIGTNSCHVGGVPCEKEMSVDFFWQEVEAMLKRLKGVSL
tara:strand:+ start:5421 stop:7409 length:1989 start_codon:yes stop_codon:yes gene_type:complete